MPRMVYPIFFQYHIFFPINFVGLYFTFTNSLKKSLRLDQHHRFSPHRSEMFRCREMLANETWKKCCLTRHRFPIQKIVTDLQMDRGKKLSQEHTQFPRFCDKYLISIPWVLSLKHGWYHDFQKPCIELGFFLYNFIG